MRAFLILLAILASDRLLDHQQVVAQTRSAPAANTQAPTTQAPTQSGSPQSNSPSQPVAPSPQAQQPGATPPQVPPNAPSPTAINVVDGLGRIFQVFSNQPQPVDNRIKPLAETVVNVGPLRFAGYLPDGKIIRVGSTRGRFQKLSATDLSSVSEPESLPPMGVASGASTNDKRRVAAGNWSGAAIIFDAVSQEILAQCPEQDDLDLTPITAIAPANDMSRLITGNRSSFIRSHAIDPPKLQWQSEKMDQEISGLALSNDGKYIAAACGYRDNFRKPGKLVVLDGATGKTLYTWNNFVSKVNGLAISPDSKTLLAADDQSLRSYDLTNGKFNMSSPLGGTQRIRFVDKDRILCSLFPAQLILIDWKTSEIHAHYRGHNPRPEITETLLLWAMDVSPDGSTIVTGTSHGQVALWPIPKKTESPANK